MGKGPGRDVELERRWRERIEDHDRSDLTVQAFCDQRNVSSSSFHYWKRELRRRDGENSVGKARSTKLGGSSDFLPVSIIATTTAAIEIEVAGCIVRVRRGFDEEALVRALHVLRQVDGLADGADRC